jgi:uncharacterized coiled-coil protein SlyX
MKTIEEKIISLEAYILHVEQYVEELNKVVIQQADSIKLLTKEISILKERIQSTGETPGFEKPPHY